MIGLQARNGCRGHVACPQAVAREFGKVTPCCFGGAFNDLGRELWSAAYQTPSRRPCVPNETASPTRSPRVEASPADSAPDSVRRRWPEANTVRPLPSWSVFENLSSTIAPASSTVRSSTCSATNSERRKARQSQPGAGPYRGLPFQRLCLSSVTISSSTSLVTGPTTTLQVPPWCLDVSSMGFGQRHLVGDTSRHWLHDRVYWRPPTFPAWQL